jgi:hypothetical protein
MKYAFIALIFALSVSEAHAVVYCAVGVYRAGCVARPGVAVRPPVVVVRPPVAVVRPPCRYVNGVRICR